MPRICFSAGHGVGSRKGGKIDPGAVAGGREEADFTLRLCARLADDFANLGWPTLLRDTGAYYEADDDAFQWKAEYFVEIHLNAGPVTANGTETLVNSGAPEGSARLAKLVQSRLVSALKTKDRGVRTRNDLAVLRPHGRMKSILLEVFFITSAYDVARWKKNYLKAELAIVNGILVASGRKPVSSLPRTWGPIRRRLIKRV